MWFGRLNDQKIQTNLARAWTRATVHEVLTNEKYISDDDAFIMSLAENIARGKCRPLELACLPATSVSATPPTGTRAAPLSAYL